MCFAQFTHLYEVPILNKKEDETLFKTGNSQKTTPSNASSSIYSLLNKLQNVNNTDTKFSLDVDRFSNDLRIHTMYAKNKGNNDDTANAKALASTSETSVGNVSFNSSFYIIWRHFFICNIACNITYHFCKLVKLCLVKNNCSLGIKKVSVFCF